jgi:CCR4-NOT transcriptional regulation complex NOT5 subunit
VEVDSKVIWAVEEEDFNADMTMVVENETEIDFIMTETIVKDLEKEVEVMKGAETEIEEETEGIGIEIGTEIEIGDEKEKDIIE